jgi:hypothetical protein
MGDRFLEPNKAAQASGGGDNPEEHLPVYAGKWTQQEEQYAQFLMEEFRAGNIPNLEGGATLRNYLAKMLICLPKRVTKKYERSGYNGKLTYQANLVTMSPQQAQARRQQLAVSRANFIESRKQRLCLPISSSNRMEHHNTSQSLEVSASASLNVNAATTRGSRAINLSGALLGGSSLARELPGASALLEGVTRLDSAGQHNLHAAPPVWRHCQMIDHLTSRVMNTSPGVAMGQAPMIGSSKSSLTSAVLHGLSDQRFLSNQFIASIGAPQQRDTLVNSSSFLPRQGVASGIDHFLPGIVSLRQQHVLARLQIENEQNTIELLAARRQLLAEIQMEKERKVALQRALAERYQRYAVTQDAGVAISGAVDGGEREESSRRQAGLKRTGDEDQADCGLELRKKPRVRWGSYK